VVELVAIDDECCDSTMVWEHVDLNELPNDVVGFPPLSSSKKKVNAVVEVDDLFVDLRLDLILLVDVLLLLGDISVDCVCQTNVGIRVETKTGTGVWIETKTGIVVGDRIGVWVRCNAKIVAVIIFDITWIMKIV
jgi:hypothetical protein